MPALGLTESPTLILAIVALVAGVVLALAVGFRLGLGRRQKLHEDVREVVEGLEQLRAGRARPRAEMSATSPLAVVSDALQRLGHDLNARFADADAAAERWRALIDATGDVAVITTDNDGDIRSFSGGAQALFGWEESEVLSRPAAVVFDESSYKDLLPKLARRSLRQKGIQVQCKLLKRDGSSFDAEVSVRGLTSTSSHPLGFMMVVRDVTEQVRMARQLRESEERYRGLVEGLAEGVVIVRDGRVIYSNPAAERLCGGSSQELHETRWRDHVATQDVLVTEEALAEIERQGGATRDLRCTLVGRQGQSRAEVRIKGSSLSYGGVPAVLLLIGDETTERRIEAELRRNETRLDAVLEATSDGILVLSVDGPASVVRMTNRAFAGMFGLRVAEVLGAPERELLRWLRRQGAGPAEVAEWIGGGAADGARMNVTLDGESARDVQVTMAHLTDQDGQQLGRVVACRDVTEQRESERELQAQADRLQASKADLERSHERLNEVHRKLEQRGEELARLNEELRRLDEMKSNLLGNVSHELQTPLVSIRGYTEMILKERLGPISAEQRKGLELSLRNIDRLISMIDNLLAFNRTDPQLSELQLARFDFGPLVQEVVELLSSKIAVKNIEVSVDLDERGLPIRADRNKIHQVLVNLLSNAIKFNRDRGRVVISAQRGRSGYVTVRVRDTGLGIPAPSLGRIFERHYQVRPGGPEEGSGIGLAIVRDILRLHGCTIHAESTEDEGSEFIFTLPMGEDPATAQTGPAIEAETPLIEGPPASRALRPRLRIIRPGSKKD